MHMFIKVTFKLFLKNFRQNNFFLDLDNGVSVSRRCEDAKGQTCVDISEEGVSKSNLVIEMTFRKYNYVLSA